MASSAQAGQGSMDYADQQALAVLYPALAEGLRGLPGGAAGLRWMDVDPGTVLFDEQQPCMGLACVLSGGVRVIKRLPEARGGRKAPRQMHLYDVTPGESCAATLACLAGDHPYRLTGVANPGTRLALVPTPVFFALLDQSAAFRRFVFDSLATRIVDLLAVVEEVSVKRLDERLAAHLLGRGRVVEVTHQELADEIGSVREIVSRLLRSFAEQGWIAQQRQAIEILDARALRELADGGQRSSPDATSRN
ncbi:Crp/Fnr family transcriptional regulator [Piscinibacterium candidicorallinum]|uniref:Crp/Fnr family transcriptional regulator n=1 Tax=Piscinibacterium candidicorallinum TaxID=1793872 RepID=A0ABV7H0D1_9BURK